MKVCLGHDWLTGMRGGEKVLESLCDFFPAAPLHTLFHLKAASVRLFRNVPFEPVRCKRSSTQALFGKKIPSLSAAVPMGARTEPSGSLRLGGVHQSLRDARFAKTKRGVSHISYLHTPMRYIYDRFDDYFGPGRTAWATRQFIKVVASRLRKWEQQTQDRADAYLCNSQYVRKRIQNIYGRDAAVVYPPVDAERFFSRPLGQRDGYYLVFWCFGTLQAR